MDTARRSAVDPARGLSASEVALRVERGDVNRVPPPNTRTIEQIVRANVFTRFNALLGAMLVLILIVGPLQDALFGVVLVANTLIGIVQELRAKRTLDRLTLLTAPTATVVRDGATARVAPAAIVRDDVLDKADVHSHRRQKAFTGDEEFPRASGSDLCDDERRNDRRNDAQLDLRKPELHGRDTGSGIQRGGIPRSLC